MTAGAAIEELRASGAAAVDGLDVAMLHRAADRIASFHRVAPAGDGAQFLRTIEAAPSTRLQRDEFTRNRPHLSRRAQAGRVRRLADGASEDLLFDLARAVLPLIQDGHALAANVLANRYADVAPQGATGWAQLPLFLSLHAERADGATLLEARPPQLVVIGGLSGTGKSTLARLLGQYLGRAPGARVIRSDVFRKRLAGLAPEMRLPPAHYTRDSDQRTYAAMFESADDHLACGTSVLLEGVFMGRSERDVAEALAERRRVPFTGLWVEAPERDRLVRVSTRTGDASDAGEDVVRLQSRQAVGEIHWHRIRTNRPIETIVAAARKALARAQG